ncbi:hypothetical protein ACHQM5_011008 [Ranunculus cassubicifolius]
MRRAKGGILASLRLIESSLITQPSSSLRSLHIQVTPYPNLSQLLPHSPPNQSTHYYFPHQKLYFSSKPSSIVELIKTNEWSEDLENELEKSTPITHETVVYVLKKLDKNPKNASNFFNWVSKKDNFKASYTVYSLMLRILGNIGTMKEFWVLIKKMSDERCDLDEETYVTVLTNLKHVKLNSDATALSEFFKKMTIESATDATVKVVTDVVLGEDWSDEVKRKLGELKVELSENMLLRIFKALRHYPLKALGYFRWVEGYLDYKHGSVTYNRMLRVLGQDQSINEFWSMVKELKNAGYEIDIDTYIKLSRQFLKSMMMKDAVELYEFMMDSPYKPSIMDCRGLLKYISLTNTPDMSLVYRVVNKYESTGHTLSKAIYDGIHRSLTSIGNFEEAEKILVTMRNAGYEPDNITYSQVVFGLCKAGRLEEACNSLEEMEAKGCVPDMKTWTILIQGHCYAGEIDKGLKCFAKMLEKNVQADADLLEILVSSLCVKNRVNAAYILLTEMVDQAKLRPWQATYKKLIEKLLGERKLEEAMNLLYSMKKKQYPPYPEPFVEFISKSGTVNDANEFLKALSMKQYPSFAAYVHILKAFFKEGRQSEARDLLYKFPHHIRNHAEITNLFHK